MRASKFIDKNELEKTLLEFVKNSYSSKDFGVPKLAVLMETSERTLARVCSKQLSMTPNKFIRQFRIRQAKKCLLKGMHAEEVASKTGFKTVGAFRVAFRKETGSNIVEFKDANNVVNESKGSDIGEVMLSATQQNYQDKDFDVVKLAELTGLKGRTLQRYCAERLSISPAKYIRKFRLEMAKKLMESDVKAHLVFSQVGFKTDGAFRVAFIKDIGVSPYFYYREIHRDKVQICVEKISAYLGQSVDVSSDTQVKNALREELGIFLPQRRTLVESIHAAANEHDVLELILQCREMMEPA